jgi:16S rRNA (cytidine1402-2'-O)-methyltransferase
MMVVFGNREVAVCNDLTKKFERVFRGTITAAIADAQSHPPRGEYTLVVAGHVEGAGNPGPFSEPDSVTRIDALRKRFDELASGEGGTRGALRTLVAESGLSRKLLYREFITRA